LSRQAVDVWTEVVRGSGTATPEEIEFALQMSLAQFAPDSSDHD
jgi:hypothetical protein